MAYENWISKYRYKQENPIDTFRRVAKELAKIEAPDKREYWEDKFFHAMVKVENGIAVGLKCTPGGRITSNAGAKDKNKGGKATLFNCFINGPVTNANINYSKDIQNEKVAFKLKTSDSPDDLNNIFLTILEQAKTLASEGGYGINFDFIRPRGSVIKGTKIKHPGVLSYMNVWDTVAAMIIKGDNDGYADTLKNYLTEEEQERWEAEFENLKRAPRKGAMMGCLTVSHPDIEEFVRAKQTPGVLTKFNISVVVTDEFMTAVAEDNLFELKFNGKVYKRIKARDLFDLIMKSTYNRAEPGILFYDNMQRNNPISYLGKVNATNPCFTGEMRLHTNKGLITFKQLHENGKKNIVVVDERVYDEGKIDTENLGTSLKRASEVVLTEKKAKILRITTLDGRELRVTPYHRFPTLTGFKEAKDLSINDPIYLQSEEGRWGKKGSFEYGILVGLLTGDGTFSQDIDYRTESNYSSDRAIISLWNEDTDTINRVRGFLKVLFNKELKGNLKKNASINGYSRFNFSSNLLYSKIKLDLDEENPRLIKARVPDFVFKGSREMIVGYLQGLFYADGSVNFSDKKRDLTLRLAQSNKKLLQDVQNLLSSFGINAKLRKARDENETMLPDGRGGYKAYSCKANYELILNRFNTIRFKERIGLFGKAKNKKLDNALQTFQKNPYKEKFETKIISIEEDGEEDVYCLNQPENESIIVNGVLTGNCGEIPGNPTISTTCLLGNLNLTAYVRKDRTFDYESFKEDVKTFARLLDNVNDISFLPLSRYENAVKSLRQYGMGLNGLGSALIMMGIPYNSPEGIAFAEELAYLKENITMQTSALLAKEKGAFPYYCEDFLDTDYFKSDRLTSETKALVKKYGVRNAKTTTNPPNGNTSIICDIVSNGIEPVFMLEYERFRMADDWPEGLNLDNVKTLLDEIKIGDAIAWRGKYKGSEYYFEPQNRGLCIVEPVRDYGYQWVLDNYPDDKKKKYLVTTEKLKVEDHISMQAAVQYYCNQSISKTINLPNDYKFENFKKVYVKGWEAGLLGVTTYRAGTMEAVIKEKDKKEEEKVMWDSVKLPKKFLNGATHVIKREGMKFYIHFSFLPADVENKKPVAIWINSNHKPKHESAQTRKMISIIADLCKEKGVNPDIVDQYMEKIMKNDLHVRLAKIASLALRHNVTPKEIVETSRDIPNLDVTTLVYAVRKFLSAHIKNGTPVQDKVCENKKCKSTNLIYESGCIKCLDCGTSGCD